MLDHVTIRTTDIERCRSFFEDLLDLRVGFRPDLGGIGYWLYDGLSPIVHLTQAETPKFDSKTEGYDHIAFRLDEYDATIQKLQGLELKYFEYKIPEIGEHRIFVNMPGGLPIELCISGFGDE